MDLAYSPDSLTLRVADDERGFDPGKANGGFGLRSMGERMEKLGGYIDVESALGKGTRVICVCPLEEARRGGRR